MLIVQDIHQVIGRRELDFESLYRSNIEPSLKSDSGMSLPFFAWCPHGSGEGYEAVTLTALADGEALDRYQERIRFGDLGEIWTVRCICYRTARRVGRSASHPRAPTPRSIGWTFWNCPHRLDRWRPS
jgi:hypothetical protein